MRFDLFALHRLEGATFRHWDKQKERATTVTIPHAQWEERGRPVSIEVGIELPAAGWFVELNAVDDPTIWESSDEPVLSRSDVPAHWDELVAKLGLAP